MDVLKWVRERDWNFHQEMLYKIISRGNFELAKWITARPRLRPNEEDVEGVIPCNLAAFKGNLDLLKWLVRGHQKNELGSVLCRAELRLQGEPM